MKLSELLALQNKDRIKDEEEIKDGVIIEADLSEDLRNKIITPNWFIPSYLRSRNKYYEGQTSAGAYTWRGEYFAFLAGSAYSDTYHIGLTNMSYMKNGKLTFETNNGVDWATAGIPNTWMQIRFPRSHIVTKVALRGRTASDHFSKWLLRGVSDWDDRSKDVLLLDYSATAYNLDNSQIHFFAISDNPKIAGFEFETFESNGGAPGLTVFNSKGFEVSSVE